MTQSINPDLIICPHQNLIEWLSDYLGGYLVTVVNGSSVDQSIEIRQSHPTEPHVYRVMKRVPIVSTIRKPEFYTGKVVIGQPPMNIAALCKEIHIFDSDLMGFDQMKSAGMYALKASNLKLTGYHVSARSSVPPN